MRSFALLVLLGLAAPAAQAQMFKCVDAHGRVVYADKPQPGCKGGPVNIQPIPSISGEGVAAPAAPKTAEQDAGFKRRQIERERQEDLEKTAQQERCQRLRQEIAWLSAGTRVARINDAGERVFMDDAAREQRLTQLRQASRGCP
jgi:hypothetical protein